MGSRQTEKKRRPQGEHSHGPINRERCSVEEFIRLEGNICLYAGGHGPVERENMMMQERENVLRKMSPGNFLASNSHSCLPFGKLLLLPHEFWVVKVEDSMGYKRNFLTWKSKML